MGTPSERLPLGGKAYGSIGHLPGSRTGVGDHHVNPGQAALFTSSPRPNHELFVQEKLDGSCVCAARIGDQILALGRDGSLASRSPNEGRRLWARWVHDHQDRFLAVLRDGERLVGEWLALVHGTRYKLRHDPFVPFDLMRGPERTPWDAFTDRIREGSFTPPALLHRGGPLPTDEAMRLLGAEGHHGAIDPPEGAVWRLERTVKQQRQVLLVAKFVRSDKVDGAYLPEITGRPALWNWRPA
jgi:hypothetical protein